MGWAKAHSNAGVDRCMSRRPEGPNLQLATCLDELGWSPKVLARKINRTFGDGTVSESAPYHWRDQGALPRSPLPTAVAHVLSQELGRTVTVEWLWQARSTPSPVLMPADSELARPWTARELGGIVEDWVASGLRDRRRFLAASGSALLALVSQYVDGSAGRGGLTGRVSQPTGSDPLIDQVEQNLPLLQLLDDEHGGARHLAYVGAQFRAVALLLHEGGHSAYATTRLFHALGEVGQLAGWMAFDAGDHGLAQRYLVTALRAAHQVNDRPLAAHILADLAFQAAGREHPADAVALGEAAARTSEGAPNGVRASVLSRLAYAYATAGRTTDFDRIRETARELVESSAPDGSEPRWMYYLTGNHLDCQAGYALIHLGRVRHGEGATAQGRRFVTRGTALLATGAHEAPLDDPSQRRALFEGAWLALGYTSSGETELACQIATTATQRLATVRSPRSTAVLQQLAGDLRRRQRNPHVRSFLPELEKRLAEYPAGAIAGR